MHTKKHGIWKDGKLQPWGLTQSSRSSCVSLLTQDHALRAVHGQHTGRLGTVSLEDSMLESNSHEPVPCSWRGHRFASQGKKGSRARAAISQRQRSEPVPPTVGCKGLLSPMPAAFPCSRHAGFDGIILLPLVDLGLLELTKPHLLSLPQCSCPAHAHPLAMAPVGW